MGLKDELEFCTQMMVNGKADIPGKKSKMGRGGNGCTEGEAGYNVGGGRQMILSVVLEVKIRRMNWKKQRDRNR